MKRAVIIFMMVLICFGNVWAKKEETPIMAQASLLKELVVTSSRMGEEKKEVTAPITIISEVDIQKSLADNLDELLGEQGMGHSHRYSETLSSVSIRGYRSDILGNDLLGQVLILQDGRRLGTGNTAQIPNHNIERIEIIRGPAAAQYGAAAMGGVVNIITKRGEGEPNIAIAGMYGSNSYWKKSISFSGATEGVDVALSALRESAGDYTTGDGRRYFNTGYDHREAVSLNLGYSPAPRHRIGIVYTYSGLFHQGNPSYLSKNDLDDYNDIFNYSVDLSYAGRMLNNLLSWRVRYFEGNDLNKWFEPLVSNPTGWNTGVTSHRDTKFKGGQSQISLEKPFYMLTAGFDSLDYKIENTWSPHKTSYVNPAAFLLAKLRLLNQRLILSGGLRYDDYAVEVVEPEGRKETDKQVTKRLGAALMLVEGLKLRANYGEAFVMPGADQMAADYMSFGRRQLGNPSLKPETSQTLDAGIDYVQGSLAASVTYFVSRYKDKIQAAITADGENTWANLGRASVAGVEADFSYDLGALLDLPWVVKPSLRATYLTQYRDEASGKDLLHVSSDLSVGIMVSYQDDFWTQLQLSYSGPQHVEDFESGLWPTPEVEMGGGAVVNLTVEKTIFRTDEAGKLSVRIAINNLFDCFYAYVMGYPMPGRQVFGGLEWRF